MLTHSTSTNATRITSFFIWGLLIVAPLFVLPLFSDFILMSKQLVLFMAALGIVVAFAVNSIRHGSLQFSFSSLSGAVFAFMISTLLSTFVTTPYPVENLLGMGGVYLASCLIVLLAGSLMPKKAISLFPLMVSVSGGILSVLSLLQTFGFGPSLVLNALFGVQLPSTVVFNVAGSPYVAAQWFGLSLVSLVLWVVITKKLPQYLFASIPLIGLGLLVSIWAILPGKPGEPLLLPYAASWSIALDTLRAPKTALVGVGLENYQAAYVLFKPAWLNNSSIWNVAFTQGSNTPFTVLTTAGIIGLLAWLSMAAVVWKAWGRSTKDQTETRALLLIALLTFAIQFFVSPNILLVIWQTVILTLVLVATRGKELFINPFAVSLADQSHPWVTPARQLPGSRYLIAIVCGALVTAALFGLYRGYYSSYLAFASLKAAQGDNILEVYNKQQQAVQVNPFLDSTRQQYGMINIQIAAALANKTDITEAEKTQVSQLIQQAIREAQAATTLNPDRSSNWQVLARIYRQLIGVAKDADQWTVSAYVRAIETAPTDPALRLELGGVFFAQENYQQALSLFQQSVQLKPDYANGYYNAANALRRLNALADAKAAYEKTLTLIPADSDAAKTAQKELDEVNAELRKVEAMNAKETGTEAENADPSTASESAQTPLSILDQTVNNAGQNVIQPPAEQATP